nr:MAG TPA: hypothetical protein [Bacteriophage sp.]
MARFRRFDSSGLLYPDSGKKLKLWRKRKWEKFLLM